MVANAAYVDESATSWQNRDKECGTADYTPGCAARHATRSDRRAIHGAMHGAMAYGSTRFSLRNDISAKELLQVIAR
ncbi:hypothetical protein [Mesorhizobium waimense]|nr:hypothetical protein [Mesorhizobium waimense]